MAPSSPWAAMRKRPARASAASIRARIESAAPASGPGAVVRRLHAARATMSRLAAKLAGHRHRRAIGHEDEQCGGGAEGASGDAVMTGPASILVLHSVDELADGIVPLLPVGAALHHQ